MLPVQTKQIRNGALVTRPSSSGSRRGAPRGSTRPLPTTPPLAASPAFDLGAAVAGARAEAGAVTDPSALGADLARALALLTPVRDHLARAAAAPPAIGGGWRGPAAQAAQLRDDDLARALRRAADLAGDVVEALRRTPGPLA